MPEMELKLNDFELASDIAIKCQRIHKNILKQRSIVMHFDKNFIFGKNRKLNTC